MVPITAIVINKPTNMAFARGIMRNAAVYSNTCISMKMFPDIADIVSGPGISLSNFLHLYLTISSDILKINKPTNSPKTAPIVPFNCHTPYNNNLVLSSSYL